jgi:hypothetical protein
VADLDLVLEIRGQEAGASGELARTTRGVQDLETATKQGGSTAQRAAAQHAELGRSFEIGTESTLRFIGALTGVEIGLSIATKAGEVLRSSVVDTAKAFGQAQQQQNAVGLGYGAQAKQVNEFADRLRDVQNVRRQDTLEASIQAVTLQKNFGLSIAQTQNLIALSSELAKVRGIGVAESFERLQSAIRGEGEAAEYLGLTLGATYVAHNAANGQYRLSYQSLTDAQRAQVLYTEAMKQGSVYASLNAISQNTLEGATDRAAVGLEHFQVAAGKALAPLTRAGLNSIAQGFNAIAELLFTPHLDVGKVSSLEEQVTKETEATDKLHASLRNVTLERDKVTGQFRFSPAGLGTAADVAQAYKNLSAAVAASLPPQQQQLHVYAQTLTATNSQTLALRQLTDQFGEYSQTVSQLTSIDQAFQRGQGVMGIDDREIQQVADLRAGVALLNIEAGNLARRQSEMASVRRAIQEVANQPILEARDQGTRREAEQRLSALDQLADAEGNLIAAQREEKNASQDLEVAQRVSTDNLRVQADAESQILSHARELREIERDLNTIQDRRTSLMQEQAQLQARQNALGGSRALQDAQTRQQELQLIARLDPSQRTMARQELRDIIRNMPRLEIADLQGRRGQTTADRAAEDTDIARGLRNIPGRSRELDIAATDEPTKLNAAASADEARQLQLASTDAQVREIIARNAVTDANNAYAAKVQDITRNMLPEPSTPGLPAASHVAGGEVTIQSITVNVNGNQVAVDTTAGGGDAYAAAVKDAAVNGAINLGNSMRDYLRNRGLPTVTPIPGRRP